MRVLNYVMFVGIISHEIAHYIACKLLNVRVLDVNLLSFKGSTLGYVRHEVPRSYIKRFIIGTIPFIFNNILTVIVIYYWYNSSSSLVVTIFVFYIGFSLSAHSFVSKSDVKILLPQYTIDYVNPLFWISIPIFLLLYAVSHTQKYYSNYVFSALFLLVVVYSLENFDFSSLVVHF